MYAYRWFTFCAGFVLAATMESLSDRETNEHELRARAAPRSLARSFSLPFFLQLAADGRTSDGRANTLKPTWCIRLSGNDDAAASACLEMSGRFLIIVNIVVLTFYSCTSHIMSIGSVKKSSAVCVRRPTDRPTDQADRVARLRLPSDRPTALFVRALVLSLGRQMHSRCNELAANGRTDGRTDGRALSDSSDRASSPLFSPRLAPAASPPPPPPQLSAM